MSEFQWLGLFLLAFGIVGVYVFWISRWSPKILKKLEPETLIKKNVIIAIIIFILRSIISFTSIPDDRFTLGLFFFIMGIVFGLCLLIFG